MKTKIAMAVAAASLVSFNAAAEKNSYWLLGGSSQSGEYSSGAGTLTLGYDFNETLALETTISFGGDDHHSETEVDNPTIAPPIAGWKPTAHTTYGAISRDIYTLTPVIKHELIDNLTVFGKAGLAYVQNEVRVTKTSRNMALNINKSDTLLHEKNDSYGYTYGVGVQYAIEAQNADLLFRIAYDVIDGGKLLGHSLKDTHAATFQFGVKF
ncbi:outer membrane beta-barrel protein [Vibrio panuliri]|uniref:Outer membrane protein beta-barrel domain-containing protein n=1 Tax=Vibrio panuliri TaxID=1381081 RepID=A0ABX3FJM6_9VIBR|nr:outer membrane beta-barrel protein [Vibrio panuliri]KAB1460864.1 porin family protein [Vibrio panuliri]OLQ91669.1 hypothetical protein BIY20_09710 [Vibrio panuliri]